MPYKFSPFTGTLDYYVQPTGNVSGVAPTTDKAIARWVGTGGDTIQNSPNTTVQDGGAIEAQGFVTKNHVTDTVEIGAGETMTLASYMDLDAGGTVIIDGDGELVII